MLHTVITLDRRGFEKVEPGTIVWYNRRTKKLRIANAREPRPKDMRTGIVTAIHSNAIDFKLDNE